MEFNGNERINARVVEVSLKPHNEMGAQKCYCTLIVTDQEGKEHEVKASVAPWMSYLNPSIAEMGDNPEQEYSGFHLLTKRGVSKKDGSAIEFVNVMGLHGIAAPDDWQEQLEAMGLAKERPKGNGKKAMPAPGAGVVDLSGQTVIGERDINDDLPLSEEEV